MQSDRDLLKQALEAMGTVGADHICQASHHAKKDQHQWGEICPLQQRWHIAFQALRERLAQPEQCEYCKRGLQAGGCYCKQPEQQAPRPDYRDWDYQDQLDEQEKPEQSPLDRMAENARELGLDYEPVQKEKPDGLQTTGPLTDRTDHVRNGGDYTPEPVAMRYDFDGYGYRYIDSGSGSNWQTRIKDAEPLYAAPPQPDTKVNFEAIPKQISEQEPVAWANQANLVSASIERNRGGQGDTHTWSETPNAYHTVPLYTTPPRREWVGLTEEEVDQTVDEEDWENDPNEFARAIEAKLKQRNT